MLCEATDKLKSLLYILSQTNLLKEMKEKLKNESCIALLDFTKNYVFVVQDNFQSYY